MFLEHFSRKYRVKSRMNLSVFSAKKAYLSRFSSKWYFLDLNLAFYGLNLGLRSLKIVQNFNFRDPF